MYCHSAIQFAAKSKQSTWATMNPNHPHTENTGRVTVVNKKSTSQDLPPTVNTNVA
jgi:hypothetical protein